MIYLEMMKCKKEKNSVENGIIEAIFFKNV